MRTRSATRGTAQARDDTRMAGIDVLSDELLVCVLAHLPSIRDFGRADGVCRAWRSDGSPVEQALRQRIAASGVAVPAVLPGAGSMTQRLCYSELLRASASSLVAAGGGVSAAVDAQGELRVWGRLAIGPAGPLNRPPCVFRCN